MVDIGLNVFTGAILNTKHAWPLFQKKTFALTLIVIFYKSYISTINFMAAVDIRFITYYVKKKTIV